MDSMGLVHIPLEDMKLKYRNRLYLTTVIWNHA